MDRRQVLGIGVGVLGVSTVLYATLAPVNDEELIAQVLDELGLALSFSEPIGNPMFFGSRLSEKFETIFAEQVRIRVSEVRANIPGSRGKLGLASARALSRYGSLNVSFSIDSLDITDGEARCEATATVAGLDRGEFRSDKRRVRLELSKAEGDWLIHSATVHEPN